MKFLYILIPIALGATYVALLCKWVNKSRKRALKAIGLNNTLLMIFATLDLLIVFTTLGELFGIGSDYSMISDFVDIGRTLDLLIFDICFTVAIAFCFLAALKVRNGLSDHRKFWVDKKIQSGVFISFILSILAFITLAIDVVLYCV